LVLAALLASGPAAADERASRLRGDLGIGFLFFDNFFQAPEGMAQRDVDGREFRGRLAYDLSASVPGLELFGTADVIDYDAFDSSSRLHGGLRLVRRPHWLEVGAGYHWNRPSFEVGDEFDQVDGAHLTGEYSYRIGRRWQVTGVGEVRGESYRLATTRDSTFVDVGGFLRYRFRSAFSPEAGVTWGGRDPEDPNEEYGQRNVIVRVRSAPVPWLYLSGGYRYRTRDYRIDDPLAGNFGRRDRRHQVKAAGDVRLHERFVLNLYWSLEDADSPKPTRVFTTSLFSVGATYRF
jgi:hypothetical protein